MKTALLILFSLCLLIPIHATAEGPDCEIVNFSPYDENRESTGTIRPYGGGDLTMDIRNKISRCASFTLRSNVYGGRFNPKLIGTFANGRKAERGVHTEYLHNGDEVKSSVCFSDMGAPITGLECRW